MSETDRKDGYEMAIAQVLVLLEKEADHHRRELVRFSTEDDKLREELRAHDEERGANTADAQLAHLSSCMHAEEYARQCAKNLIEAVHVLRDEVVKRIDEMKEH